MPTMTVLTACINAADVIQDCLRSVASQTISVEHIIVDGRSTDDTLEVIDRHRSPNVRVISEPDNGIYDALNKGIAMASGEVIGILHADDFYASENVLECVGRFLDTQSTETCYGDLHYVSVEDTDRLVRNWCAGEYARKRFLWGWMPPHPTFFVRSKLYERFGRFRTDLGTAGDYELMLRLLYKNRVTTAYLPEVLVKMRTGGISNATLAGRLKANRMDRAAWRVNNLRPYPWTLLVKPLSKLGQWT